MTPNFGGGVFPIFWEGGVSNFLGVFPIFQGGSPTGIQSTFGWYASYWNAFLFILKSVQKPECIPLGCAPSAAVVICWQGVSTRRCLSRECLPGVGLPRRCLPRGMSPQGLFAQGVSAQGGICPGVGLLRECLPGVCIQACTEADNPLWAEFLTHACDNITFP